MDTLHFRTGDSIFRQGDDGNTFFLVIAGTVELRLKSLLLERVGPGGTFGEMAIIEQLPRSADAVAGSELELQQYDHKTFLKAIADDPEFGILVMASMARRLRQANTLLGAAS